jgi:hypothetical protein
MRRRYHRVTWALGWAVAALVAGLLPAHAATPGEANDLLVTGYNAGTGELSLSYTAACSAPDHTSSSARSRR